MLSFNNDPQLKATILSIIEAHEAADEIIHGTYHDDGKFCAVGCSIHAFAKATGREFSYSNHAVYDEIFGDGGRIIAKLEDRIFEGMANGFAKQWPARLMRSVPVGRDLSMVWPKFALWLLTEELAPIAPKYPKGRAAAFADVAALYREWCAGTKPSIERWETAKAAAIAASAAYASAAAYVSAASAAAYADAAAAYAYASAAAYVSAAYVSAASAAAAYAADAYAADDARQASYRRMADRLIQILAAA